MRPENETGPEAGLESAEEIILCATGARYLIATLGNCIGKA